MKQGIDGMVWYFFQTKPDFILFELNISDPLISDVVSSLINASECSPLIFVTEIVDPIIQTQAVESSIMGLVYKIQAPEILIKAIKKVTAGEVWHERSGVTNLLSRLSRENKPANINSELPEIEQRSDREKEILKLFCLGLKNKKISEQLSINETTVCHHLTSIYNKTWGFKQV